MLLVEQQVSLPLFLIKTETDIQATFTSHHPLLPKAYIKHTAPYQPSRPLQILVGTTAVLPTLTKCPSSDAEIPHLHLDVATPGSPQRSPSCLARKWGAFLTLTKDCTDRHHVELH